MENGNKCDLKVRHSKEFRKCSTQDAIAESCNHVTISPLCVDSKTITKENHRLLITLLTDFGRQWSMVYILTISLHSSLAKYLLDSSHTQV